ncbi:mannose-6-phosphate isomerase, class I [Isoptericola sp. b441]|uniref:mannose-6-phosphate isomerase n=1 Tax=Actinotalea lenta TaxID=3064654 RepID=A0ABT9DF45_9CELL|nr:MULTISPECIES: mannose-6-phosphate isomerase, class I [unclassified Isoptericola]MDO8108566.1 mannose-6-phosphate isomerase, class I [Isoptericola sp. b441]MDO8119976.1 mannose-6-phosphate isomerase, class I [Isoptericola sp. b490]
MIRLRPTTRDYDWGSRTALPELLGVPGDGRPVAEAWFGAHPAAPATVQTAPGTWRSLAELVAEDPTGAMGADVVARFGASLPYLLKLIAAQHPLSLQVHPDRDQARAGFAAEEAAGVPRTAAHRVYPDANHKPELLYALTTFEAMAGFRAPRRAAELLADLDTPLVRRLRDILMARPDAEGMQRAFSLLLDSATRPTGEEVREVAEACRARLVVGSPSPRADGTVVRLAAEYPGDPGVVTSLLLNPVTLQPGEALFVPAGAVHTYQSGTGVELMANSDNVLRAGLTGKHVDIPKLLATVDCVAAPPIRIAPEVFHGATRIFYAPVDDFELSVTEVSDGAEHPLPGRGPRVLLCLRGEVTVHGAEDGSVTLSRGQAAFAPASDGTLSVDGDGTLVQADVP